MKPFYFTKDNGIIKGDFKNLPDGIYRVTKNEPKRTLELNRLYWGWFLKRIVIFHEEKGEVYTVEQLHKMFKEMLLQTRVYNQIGNKRRWITQTKSTADLTNKQFTDYMAKINKMYMDSYNWQVPDCKEENDLLYWESLIV